MTLALTKYTTVGRPLTKEEVDSNWLDIETALNEAMAGALPVSAISLLEGPSGQFLRFLDSTGNSLGDIPFPAMLAIAGDWETGVDYTTRHIVTFEGSTYLCREAHEAGVFAADLVSGKWMQLGSSGGGIANAVVFDPLPSDMTATDVQAAIDELAANVINLNNTLVSIWQAIDANTTAINALDARVAALENPAP